MPSFQTRITKHAVQYKRSIRAAELIGGLLAEGSDWQAPYVRAQDTGSEAYM